MRQQGVSRGYRQMRHRLLVKHRIQVSQYVVLAFIVRTFF